LVATVNTAQSFSILVDDTTDVSNKKQMTLCICYFDLNANRIREDYLQCKKIQNISEIRLFKVKLKSMTEFGININI